MSFYPKFLSFEIFYVKVLIVGYLSPWGESLEAVLAPTLRDVKRGLFSTDTSSGTEIMLRDHS